jgi:outer membrane protease
VKHRFLSVALFVFAAADPLRLSAVDYSFDIGGGLKGGMTKEYVYEGEKCISRLDWADDSVPVLTFAGQAEFPNMRETLSPKLFMRAALTTAVPVKSGAMEDYDFLIPGSTAPSLYSKHDAYLDKDITFDFWMGAIFRFWNWKLVPSVGMSYTNRKWTAQDGYLQYPASGPWTGDEPKQGVSGPVISYEQALMYPFVSLSAGYTVKNRIAFTLTGSISPFLIGETVDSHFLRSVRFYDTFKGGDFFSDGFAWTAGLSIQYYPVSQKQLAFFIRGGYKGISNLTGSTASGKTSLDDGTLVTDEGYSSKIAYYAVNVSVGMVLYIVR